MHNLCCYVKFSGYTAVHVDYFQDRGFDTWVQIGSTMVIVCAIRTAS